LRKPIVKCRGIGEGAYGQAIEDYILQRPGDNISYQVNLSDGREKNTNVPHIPGKKTEAYQYNFRVDSALVPVEPRPWNAVDRKDWVFLLPIIRLISAQAWIP
jgi:hypothetical protein